MTATVSQLVQSSLPGVDDPTLPSVAVVVDDDTWDVALDVTGQVDLTEFFDAIAASPVLREAMRRLLWNRKNPSIRRDALAEFTSSPAIRKALTVALAPGRAEALGILLDDASREPFPRCEWQESGSGCNRFVTDKGELCPEHVEREAELRALDAYETGPWSR